MLSSRCLFAAFTLPRTYVRRRSESQPRFTGGETCPKSPSGDAAEPGLGPDVTGRLLCAGIVVIPPLTPHPCPHEARHTDACHNQSPTNSGPLSLPQKCQWCLNAQCVPLTPHPLPSHQQEPVLSCPVHIPERRSQRSTLLLSGLPSIVRCCQVTLIRTTGSLRPQEMDMAHLGLRSSGHLLCPSCRSWTFLVE